MSTERTISTALGTSFRALDTGAPTRADYLTLVFLHGWGIPSTGITSRIAALAPAEGVRFIGVNRRGYLGSSTYSIEEARVLKGGTPEERAAAYRDEGLQYAHLLDTLAQDGTIGEGGVALIAWSAANAHLNAIIACVHDLPGPIRARLSQRMKAFIYFEAVPPVMGMRSPSGLYQPILDESVPHEVRAKNSQAWFASYFAHDLAARDVSRLETRTIDHTRPATDALEGFYEKYSDPAGALPGDEAMFVPDVLPQIRAARDAALFDDSIREAWNRPKVAYLWAESSVWVAVWAAWALEDEHRALDAELKARGSSVPLLTFRTVKGSNHYALFDHPKETLQAFLECAQ